MGCRTPPRDVVLASALGAAVRIAAVYRVVSWWCDGNLEYKECIFDTKICAVQVAWNEGRRLL